MKLIIQIPCFNEAESLPETLLALPRHIEGIDEIEYIVIDDGSVDDTSGVAQRFGVHHIVRHRTNRGLAAAFRTGLNKALAEGADIIVNTDADNQYDARDIETIVAPVLSGEADIVIGDRQVASNEHFGAFKRRLQVFGSHVVQKLSGTKVTDAVSGFRAISRNAAQRIYVVSRFSYTTEMLIQAGRNRLSVISVPVRTNAVMRPSRLFKSIPQFLLNQSVTIVRAYSMYNPLKVFVMAGGLLSILGAAPVMRFIYFYAIGEGTGHVQSLVLGGTLLTLGMIAMMLGLIADLIGRNRQLMEQALQRVRVLEDQISQTESSHQSAMPIQPPAAPDKKKA